MDYPVNIKADAITLVSQFIQTVDKSLAQKFIEKSKLVSDGNQTHVLAQYIHTWFKKYFNQFGFIIIFLCITRDILLSCPLIFKTEYVFFFQKPSSDKLPNLCEIIKEYIKLKKVSALKDLSRGAAR